MDVLIDTRNGLAGDITAAGLIGLGASPVPVIKAMETAGNMIGRAKISHSVSDGIHRLDISLAERPDHLHADNARELLLAALRDAGIRRPWLGMGLKVLEVLAEAEGHVHRSHAALRSHFHGHETVLHEASDIILDIAGMAAGMQALDIRKLYYLDHVNVGGGTVTFSHGTLEVPTPATRRILEVHEIVWRKSDAGTEMATPTGASILAGCGATRVAEEPHYSSEALAGGTRPLPPVRFMLL